jgi:putative inorganic carbon (HCO3(-)) transporter
MQLTVKARNILAVYLLTALFLIASLFFTVETRTLWLFVLPLVIIVLYYYVVALDKVLLFITFFTPLAINLKDANIGAALSVPTEPLMFGVVIVFLVNLLLERNYNRRVASHPLSYLIYFSLLWMLVTSFTSHLPLVSFKHLLSRIWFVVPFYFVAIPMFRKEKNIHRFLWLYIVALSGVIVYTLVRHASHGFDEESGHWVMSPFYNDHTAYGAALAMFFPVLTGYLVYPGYPLWKKMLTLPFFVLYVVAIVFSYTRAAWLGIGVAGIVWLLVLLRVRFRWVLAGFITLVVLGFVFYQPIVDQMEKNKQDSSTNMEQHLQSMTNVSSDASNLERINRWASAWRMFEKRPLLGWGPGTYQFVYAPFQLSSERTIISTNTGDRGTAHSEYLGPLSEEGVPGLLIVLALFGYSIFLGLKLYHRSKNLQVRRLSLMITLGLITYYVHGFLNNFLDTDKLSVPVWGFMAILVSLDVYFSGEEKQQDISAG